MCLFTRNFYKWSKFGQVGSFSGKKIFLQFCVQLSTSFLQLFLKKQINFWIQNLCKIARGNIIREQLLFIFCIGIRKKISHTDFAYLFNFSNISGISSAPITNYSQGVPSMHICLDFAPELLRQADLDKQIFAVNLISHLSVQYALPKSYSTARLAINVLSSLLSGNWFKVLMYSIQIMNLKVWLLIMYFKYQG